MIWRFPHMREGESDRASSMRVTRMPGALSILQFPRMSDLRAVKYSLVRPFPHPQKGGESALSTPYVPRRRKELGRLARDRRNP